MSHQSCPGTSPPSTVHCSPQVSRHDSLQFPLHPPTLTASPLHLNERWIMGNPVDRDLSALLDPIHAKKLSNSARSSQRSIAALHQSDPPIARGWVFSKLPPRWATRANPDPAASPSLPGSWPALGYLLGHLLGYLLGFALGHWAGRPSLARPLAFSSFPFENPGVHRSVLLLLSPSYPPCRAVRGTYSTVSWWAGEVPSETPAYGMIPAAAHRGDTVHAGWTVPSQFPPPPQTLA